LPEVLRIEVGDEVRRLGAPDPVLDPAMAAIVESAAAAAEGHGYREGERAGRAAAEAAAERGAAAIVDAVQGVRDEIRSQREAACRATLDVAERLAREVVGRTPPDDAMVVLDRVRQVIDALDDDHLEIRVHPDDEAALAGHLDDARLQLVADPSVASGDARVLGAWGGAELTREALLAAALAGALEVEG
jgi:flagellar biosynthesis/type III secretory pathway protein FliH